MSLQDSGGYTSSEELPAAEHVYLLNSEHNLKPELVSFTEKLSSTAEWAQ